MLLYFSPVGYDPSWKSDEQERKAGRSYKKLHLGISVWKMRRDSFAYLRSAGEKGEITSEILTISTGAKPYLFLNAAPDNADRPAKIRVSIRRVDGSVSLPWSDPITTDSTKHRVRWSGRPDDVFGQSDKDFVIVFELTNARLYSFWASCCPSGESDGWSSAGQDSKK